MSQTVAGPCAANLKATGSGDRAAMTPSLRFGCPYYMCFGLQGVKGRSCTGEGCPDAHRVKYTISKDEGIRRETLTLVRGHLYRLHAPAISCPRCYSGFKDQNEVILHLRREDICDLLPSQTIDTTTTFTETQRQQLKRRLPTNLRSLNDSEQCEEIYRILFPDKPLPDLIC